ncbi:hypothetical protein, partial [Leptospira noguchii]|uniref:hypothetical protein n=1 Tax=Leptospira noguchii TaxID=28182 RepID=UPI0038D414C2
MTPSIQEYHTRNCLMFKKHTNLWSLDVNSASHSPNSAKRFLRKRFRSFEVNSASHSPWVVRSKLSV